MHNKMCVGISTDESLEMTNSDQEMITVNRSGLINDISNLLAVGFIFGVIIGASIMQLIIRCS